MSTVFSGEEIIKMAIKTEDAGYKLYSQARDEAKTKELKSLFDYLAKEELKHKEIYSGLTDAIAESSQGLPVDWKDVELYIEAMIDSSLFIGADKNINLSSSVDEEKEAVDFAIKFEKDTLLFFYQIKEIVKDVNRDVVERIIGEEKKHIYRLAEIKRTL